MVLPLLPSSELMISLFIDDDELKKYNLLPISFTAVLLVAELSLILILSRFAVRFENSANKYSVSAVMAVLAS